ncbi:unnamed protein product [Cuscuta campestris]|uniref:Uncharacterized protein n=1 Tax=Cuscuta campestris TaxID=132261 RepID=A0A484KJG1_9ASTE|nr:unnamed protein product [Cuscuta campestris]
MNVCRWTCDFDPSIDSPLAPVWIGLEGLPLHLFEPNALFSIANLVGLPLQMDSATVNLTRPSVARVCVELDLTKDMPKAVWIHLGQLSFLQPITYEDLPEYCISCRAIGHKKCKTPRKSSRWFRREGKLSSRSLNDSVKVLVPESGGLGANSVIAHNAPNHAVDISAAPSFADATFAIPNSSTKTPVSTDALLEGPLPLVQTCSDENEQAKDPTILIGKIQCTKDASLLVPTVAENLLGKDVAIPTDPLLSGPVVAESFLGKDVVSPTDPAPPLTVFVESTVLHSPPFVPLPEVVHTHVPLIADSNVPDASDAHSTLRKDVLDGSHDNSVCGDDEIISDPNIPTQNRFVLLTDPMITEISEQGTPNSTPLKSTPTKEEAHHEMSRMTTRRSRPPIIEGFIVDCVGEPKLECEGYNGPFLFLGPPGSPREDGKRPRTAIPTKISPHTMVNV